MAAWLNTLLRFERHILIAAMLFLSFFAILRLDWLLRQDNDGAIYDPMLTSGYFTALFGIWLSFLLEGAFSKVSRQLERDGIIDWKENETTHIASLRVKSSLIVAGAVVVVLLIGFLGFHFRGLPTNTRDWEFLLTALLLGAIAGHRLGAGAAYGQIGRRAAKRETELTLILGHSDQFGGARRLGEFMALQGVLVSIPIVWLSIWLFLANNHPGFAQYSHWFWPHMALLAIALTISWFNFVQPLLRFSQKFRAQKEEIMSKWTQRARSELNAQQRSFQYADTVDEAADSIKNINRISAFNEQIAALPSIPLRNSVTGVFSAATLFPAATFLVDLLLPKDQGLGTALAKTLEIFSTLLGLK